VAILSRSRGRRLGLATLLLALAFTKAFASDAPVVGEYQVKAAFLFNFAKFVTWPSGAFEGPESPIEICVAGRDPFGGALEDTIGERTVRGRPVAVRQIDAAEQASDCEIVFFADSERAPVLARRLERAPVLTVGETAGFAEAGGIVNFKIEENRVRFEINPDAASRAGLRVSSQLLNLATVVREERK
jgi:hypothetical protein